MQRQESYFVPSIDVSAAKIPDFQEAYCRFKSKLLAIAEQQSNQNLKDEEQVARTIALGQAAYENFRTETSGIQQAISVMATTTREDLLTAAKKYLSDFTTFHGATQQMISTAGDDFSQLRRKIKATAGGAESPTPMKRMKSRIDSSMHGIDATTWIRESPIAESEADYIESITAESDGIRKAINVLTDLDIPASGAAGASLRERLCSSEGNVCVIDVGASVGSNCIELMLLLSTSSYGIVIEYMAEACAQAMVYAHSKGMTVSFVPCPGISQDELVLVNQQCEKYKTNFGSSAKGHVYIFQGDATANFSAVKNKLQELHSAKCIDCILVTCHAVLHELPTRSPNFSFATMMDSLLLQTGVEKWVIYAREPSFPAEPAWSPGKLLYLQIPGWLPEQLAEMANHLSLHLPGLQGKNATIKIVDRSQLSDLAIPAKPSSTATNRLLEAYQAGAESAENRSDIGILRLDALLAMELLYKTLFYVGSKHLYYECGEQLTSFETGSFMTLLSDHCKADHVFNKRYTSGTFAKFWELWQPRVWNESGTRLRGVPVPSTVVIGWRGMN